MSANQAVHRMKTRVPQSGDKTRFPALTGRDRSIAKNKFKRNRAVEGGFRIAVMAAILRVDPTRLRTAAAAQADVGTFVSGMGTGQSMASGGTGMSGLLSEAACQFAGTVFDAAAGAVHDELTAHSTNLSAAADHYRRVDEEFGRRLRKLARRLSRRRDRLNSSPGRPPVGDHSSGGGRSRQPLDAVTVT
jgi:hypothetical protein